MWEGSGSYITYLLGGGGALGRLEASTYVTCLSRTRVCACLIKPVNFPIELQGTMSAYAFRGESHVGAVYLN